VTSLVVSFTRGSQGHPLLNFDEGDLARGRQGDPLPVPGKPTLAHRNLWPLARVGRLAKEEERGGKKEKKKVFKKWKILKIYLKIINFVYVKRSISTSMNFGQNWPN